MTLAPSRLVGALATLVLFAACDSPTTPNPSPTPPTSTTLSTPPSPTPTPTPPPSMTGFWLIESGQLRGYGIEVTQTGSTFRGRAVFPLRNLTGPTEGTVSASGAVRYDTSYGAGDFDTFEGQLDASRNSMTGTVVFILRSINFEFTFNNVTMVRQQ